MVKGIYAKYIVNDQFTTEELISYPHAKAVIDSLRGPLKAVTDFDFDISIADCKTILLLLKVCTDWPEAALPKPAAARPILQTADTRAHRCIEVFDKVLQQHALLSQLYKSIASAHFNLLRLQMSLPESSTAIAQHDNGSSNLMQRLESFKTGLKLVFKEVTLWSMNSASLPEAMAPLRATLGAQSRSLTAMAAKSDRRLAEELPSFSRYCRNMHAYLLPLSLTDTDDFSCMQYLQTFDAIDVAA